MESLRRFVVHGLALAVLIACMVSPAIAQDELPGNVSETWVFHVKAGQEEAFDEAFKKHLAARKAKGDPRSWQSWVPVTGEDLSGHLVRSCCHAWKDLDAYEEWVESSGVRVDWNENVHPYVERYEHYFGEMDIENSHWPPGDGLPRFVGVTSFFPKMGKARAVAEHIAAFSTAAKEIEWPYKWAWSRTIGGEGGLILGVPYDNFAAMEPPEKTFVQALSEKMGATAAAGLFDAWADNFEKTHYTIYRHVADLSMPMEE